MSEDKAEAEKHSASKKYAPTHEEVERIVKEVFPTPSLMCPGLCEEIETLWDLLETDPGLTGKQRAQLLIRLHSISAQLQQLKCRCTPQ